MKTLLHIQNLDTDIINKTNLALKYNFKNNLEATKHFMQEAYLLSSNTGFIKTRTIDALIQIYNIELATPNFTEQQKQAAQEKILKLQYKKEQLNYL